MQVNKHDLVDIARRLGISFRVRPTTRVLLDAIYAELNKIHAALLWAFPTQQPYKGTDAFSSQKRLLLLYQAAKAKGWKP